MISVVFIINNEKNFKNFKNIKYDELYKKCGYKSNDNFVKLHERRMNSNNNNDNDIYYEYWGKNVGKESFKYKFDNITYYNKLLIIKKDGTNFLNIREDDITLIDKSYCANEEVNNSTEENNNSSPENTNEKDANNIKEDDEELDNDTNSELSEEPYLFSSDEDED
tara:strand:+ start:1027 stop:1524 length:498 start_codon:yes stop_codon:yes gene_type:complete